jgi:hypothetical protein
MCRSMVLITGIAVLAGAFLTLGGSPAAAVSKAYCEIRHAVCVQSCDREVPSLQQKCRQVCRSNKYRCLKNAN